MPALPCGAAAAPAEEGRQRTRSAGGPARGRPRADGARACTCAQARAAFSSACRRAWARRTLAARAARRWRRAGRPCSRTTASTLASPRRASRMWSGCARPRRRAGPAAGRPFVVSRSTSRWACSRGAPAACGGLAVRRDRARMQRRARPAVPGSCPACCRARRPPSLARMRTAGRGRAGQGARQRGGAALPGARVRGPGGGLPAGDVARGAAGAVGLPEGRRAHRRVRRGRRQRVPGAARRRAPTRAERRLGLDAYHHLVCRARVGCDECALVRSTQACGERACAGPALAQGTLCTLRLAAPPRARRRAPAALCANSGRPRPLRRACPPRAQAAQESPRARAAWSIGAIGRCLSRNLAENQPLEAECRALVIAAAPKACPNPYPNPITPPELLLRLAPAARRDVAPAAPPRKCGARSECQRARVGTAGRGAQPRQRSARSGSGRRAAEPAQRGGCLRGRCLRGSRAACLPCLLSCCL